MSYQCPVCGYDRMSESPKDFAICPCCGVEFGYDDFECSHSELRSQWISKGMPWFSQYTLAPQNWNPYLQLAQIPQSASSEKSEGDPVFISVNVGNTRRIIEAADFNGSVAGHLQLLSTAILT